MVCLTRNAKSEVDLITDPVVADVVGVHMKYSPGVQDIKKINLLASQKTQQELYKSLSTYICSTAIFSSLSSLAVFATFICSTMILYFSVVSIISCLLVSNLLPSSSLDIDASPSSTICGLLREVFQLTAH